MARRSGPYTCSFCGKGREQTRHLIAGPNGVYICAECVALCTQILSDLPPAPSPPASGEPHDDPPPPWQPRLHGEPPDHEHL